MAESLAALGAPREVLEAWQPQPSEPLAILPDAWPAVRLFIALGTQWRWGPEGRPVGLDYGAIRPAAELSGITPTPELFDDLRVMEAAALEAMGE